MCWVRSLSHLKATLAETLDKKLTLKDIKHEIASNTYYQSLFAQIRSSPIGTEATAKYLKARKRAQSMDKIKSSAVKKAMTQARRRFLGCLATKIPTQVYDEVLDSFDQQKYDHIKIIPSTLKHRVHENTTNEVLKEHMVNSLKYINLSNNLPSGLKSYMRRHPQEFVQQNREIQSQRKLSNMILRSMKADEIARLQAHIEEHKQLDMSKLPQILGR